MMMIAVIGTGYVGLVTGVCLAKIGHNVICVDNDEGKIKRLCAGELPMFEPGLAELMREAKSAGRLRFSMDTLAAVSGAQAVILAIGTPTSADGQTLDLTAVFAAARQVAQALDAPATIIIKSTVPIGTARKIETLMHEAAPAARFEVVSNPEFLREGFAISDFMNPCRLVVGSRSAAARHAMEVLYAPFLTRNVTMVHTDLETAEITKFACNGLLATKVAFINEIAALCEKNGANVRQVAHAMGLDDRIGPKFLAAGPGFGGSCFPKDLRALAAMVRHADITLPIAEAVILSNENTKKRMVAKILALAGGDVQGQRLAIFGVTFKADTDDLREAPSLTILPPLLAGGAELHIVDPEGHRQGEAHFQAAHWFTDAYEAAGGADMVVVLTEWQTFRELDLARLARAMRRPRLADLRGLYSAEELRAAGFETFCQVGHGR